MTLLDVVVVVVVVVVVLGVVVVVDDMDFNDGNKVRADAIRSVCDTMEVVVDGDMTGDWDDDDDDNNF